MGKDDRHQLRLSLRFVSHLTAPPHHARRNRFACIRRGRQRSLQNYLDEPASLRTSVGPDAVVPFDTQQCFAAFVLSLMMRLNLRTRPHFASRMPA